MRYLGIDYGTKRVGLAISDEIKFKKTLDSVAGAIKKYLAS